VRSRFPTKITAATKPLATMTTSHDFQGAVALSNCSGSLVRLETSTDADKAWVLTNGHCLGGFTMIEPGVVKTNVKTVRKVTVFNEDLSNKASFYTTKLLYGTMTKTDIAIYQLDETYGEIMQDHNLEAYTLSSTEPTVGTEMEIVSGYWKKATPARSRQSSISSRKTSGRWSNPSATAALVAKLSAELRAHRLSNRERAKVIAINNTGNEDGEECTMNNPCEIDAAGKKTFVKGYAYGQQTAWIYSCLQLQSRNRPNHQGLQTSEVVFFKQLGFPSANTFFGCIADGAVVETGQNESLGEVEFIASINPRTYSASMTS
jgi:hypothetical protein